MEGTEGMEVFVHHLPPHSTDKSFAKFLKPFMATLSIKSFHCQKQRGKNIASITFLHPKEAWLFLAAHGQANTAVAKSRRAINNTTTLIFQNQPIYCKASDRLANPYLIRVLQRELKEQRDLVPVTSTRDGPGFSKIVFDCCSMACGTWSYVGSALVFISEVKWEVSGKARFTDRAMILKLDSGQRIDFRYSGIESITAEDSTYPSITLTMNEAPHFFENPDPLLSALEMLSIGGKRPPNAPNRARVSHLGMQHESVSGLCLVYRVTLSNDFAHQVGDHMQALKRNRGMPPIIHQRTYVQQAVESYAAGLQRLQKELSASYMELPFTLAFQVQKLSQNCYLSPLQVLRLLPEITNMARRSTITICVIALRKLFNQILFAGPGTEANDFDMETMENLLKGNEEQAAKEKFYLPEAGTTPDNVAIIHRAKVTPAGVYLYGPEDETKNRVLRKYPDHHSYFLRVQFCDEDGRPVQFVTGVSNDAIFNGRFKSVLDGGINIAGRKYDFLGFSHSSLRAQSCWFMAPFVLQDGTTIHAQKVIEDLGDFSKIRSPAKCAARIGQAFSDTPTAITLEPGIVKIMEDVERNKRVFSDGVGTMSMSVKDKICSSLSSNASVLKPTCFQMRFRGSKGMISLDTRLHGDALMLRPSMIKYEGSDSNDIELCGVAYRPLPMYLNRQFIKILEDMGVEENFFMNLQAKEVERLRSITASTNNASTFLERQSIGQVFHLPWLIRQLPRLNLNFRADSFLRDVLEMTIVMELRQLKHKGRIPVQKGYHLYGLMDETGILEEGQIFCTVIDSGVQKIITGKNMIVSRAPALHPGDIQLVDAVSVPLDSPLRSLTNCICFSQKGPRDLPSQLSGGDLDGDLYYIMWDPNAKPKQIFQPADYPRQDPVDIGREVTKKDMTDFFIKFMETDQLGRIATLHQILADQRDNGTCDADCITLAEMHSTAVDFSKTGIPVNMSKMPKYSSFRPDFMAPGPHVTIHKMEGLSFEEPSPLSMEGDDDDDFTPYRYYESSKILGKLYRAIDEREFFNQVRRERLPLVESTSTVIEDVWKHVQRKCQGIQWDHYLNEASDIREMYEDYIQNVMTDYSEHPLRPVSELEAFVGNLLGKTGALDRRQKELSTSLKESFDRDTTTIVNCIVKDEYGYSDEALERSIACLQVSLEDWTIAKRKEQLVSFKYLAAGVCLREVERLHA